MSKKQRRWPGLGLGLLLGGVLHLISTESVAAPGSALLGDVMLRSFFAQPLEVEVPLRLPRDVNLSEVKVRLATHDRFKALGVDRDAITQPLAIDLRPGEVNPDPIVRITSRGPMRELALALVLEIDTVHSVTYHVVDLVLGSPPSAQFAVPAVPVRQSIAAPSRTAELASAGKQIGPAPVYAGRGDGAKSLRPALNAPSVLKYGPTGRFDTLFGIAAQVRPDTSVSVRDMAMALFRANPQAFFRDNINNLRLGVVLKVPVLEDNGRFAANSTEIGRQIAEWKAERRSRSAVDRLASPPVHTLTPSTPSTRAADANSGAAGEQPAGGNADAGRANVVPASVATAAGEGLPTQRQFRERIAREQGVREQLDRRNRALRSRMAELDERIAAIRELLERQGAALAALGSQVSGTGKVVGDEGTRPAREQPVDVVRAVVANSPALVVRRAEPVPEVQASDTFVSAKPKVVLPTAVAAQRVGPQKAGAPVSSAALEPDPPDTIAVTNPVAAKVISPPVRATPVSHPQHVETSVLAFLESLSGEWAEKLSERATLLALAVVVGLLVAWVVVRRITGRAVGVVNDREHARREAGLLSHVSEKAAKANGLKESPIVAPPPRLEAVPAMSRSESSSQSVDPKMAVAATNDAMEALFREVDVFVAYGRFDDAANRLKVAMEEQPHAYELRAKLGEVLSDSGDADGFIELAGSLYLRLRESGNEALWARMQLLGQRLAPEEPLFERTLSNPAPQEMELIYDEADELAQRRRRY